MKDIIFTLGLISLLSMGCKDKQATASDVGNKQDSEMKSPEKSTSPSKKTILCFGNSLTAGHGLEEKYAWPTLLQHRIDSLKLNYQVVNAGLSGETTSGGLNRIDWVLKQPVDVFFLELGANDMLRGLSVEASKENLEGIILKVKSKYPDVPIILAGMLSPPNMGPEYEKAFNSMYADLSKKHNASLIPFFLDKVAGIKELNNADGIHPNAEGSKIILETVWGVMKLIVNG